MKKLLQNRDGATAVEFALAFLPIILFIFGIMQTAYILCIYNMLHYSVDFSARCAAIRSTTSPCNGSDMQAPAEHFFPMADATTFVTNTSSCSGSGLTGTYQVSILNWTMTLTANSCYPTPPP